MKELEPPKQGIFGLIKEYLWPIDPASRAKRRAQYKNCGIFIVTSVAFYKYGRELAALVYDQDVLEDNVRMSMR